MNILVIAPEAYPPTTGESIVTTKFIAALKKAGHTVFVIHHEGATRAYPSQQEDFHFSFIEKNLVGLPNDGSVLKRVRKISLSWVFEAFLKASEIINNNKIDLIYSRVMPPYGHLPALLLSYRFSIPWLANWSDPTPLAISPEPYTRPFKRKDKIIFGLLKKVAQRAHWHTFPNKHLAAYMQKFYPEIKERFSVIPHIAYSPLFIKPEYSRDTFTICHVGGLELREPGNFIKAVILFLKKYSVSDISILFVGPIEQEAVKLVTELRMENYFTFIPSVSYEKSLEYMAKSDVSLVIEADMKEGIFLPSKVMDIVQLGKPILAVSPKHGVMNDLLALKKGGIAADRNNSDEISQAIETLYAAFKKNELDAVFGSSVLREDFNEDTVIRNFCAIWECIRK